MPKLPAVTFSNWFHWKKRTEIEGCGSPGVYMLAKFRTPPTGKANPLNENIIYFGETCEQTLKIRWNDFDKSAFQGNLESREGGKSGHSGGWTYRDDYFNDRKGKIDTGRCLYTAAAPQTEKDHGDSLPYFIRYLERKLIFDFAYKYGAEYLIENLLNKK